VTVDLWDCGRLDGTCASCMTARRERLGRMNLAQRSESRVPIDCGCAV